MVCRLSGNARLQPHTALPLYNTCTLPFAPCQGPTLSELLSYGQAALSLAGQAWHAVVSPLAVFGEDHWNLNLLFYAAVLLVGYNLVVAAPKQ